MGALRSNEEPNCLSKRGYGILREGRAAAVNYRGATAIVEGSFDYPGYVDGIH